jgi:hypothetical protein
MSWFVMNKITPNINTEEFEVNGIKIYWGKTLNQARSLLKNTEILTNSDKSVSGKCVEIFGLKANEFSLRSPHSNKPILQVSYEIEPIYTNGFKKRHTPYLEKLQSILGKPIAKEEYYNPIGIKKEFMYSVVIFSAKWQFKDIRISLSVYGGIRNNKSGESGAGIYIDWIDLKKAAKPFINEVITQQNEFIEEIYNKVIDRKFKLNFKQRPFFLPESDQNNPYANITDTKLRVSQIALYCPTSFITPKQLSKDIEEDEVVLYYSEASGKIYLSNKWDTTFVKNNEYSSEITYYDVLPARGNGRKQLQIKRLFIEDSRDSNSILKLVRAIEDITGKEVKKLDGFDD